MEAIYTLRNFFRALMVLMLFAFSCSEEDDPAGPGVVAEPDPDELLQRVNDARQEGRSCGDTYYEPAPPVAWNSLLTQAAQRHADDMEEAQVLSHEGQDGSSAGMRIRETGYDWSNYGENVAEAYPTEEAVVKAWLESPGHCRNIMNPAFEDMGVATSGSYWTQVLGAR